MRYKTLVQMAEMCDTLVEATTYIAKAGKCAATAMLLDTCDEILGAITAILKKNPSKEEHKAIVEAVETVRKTLSTSDDISKVMTDILDIKSTLINKVKYKYRVIFIAELGEKWDSLESLYYAFLEKENCDVAIVLSPIFRENGGKKDIIYKDYFTPLGIPFIEYKDYDFEKDMPDVAFTCQPYETVTIPMFWPENIAKHTRLVYVPYFAPDIYYDDSILTLCQMPAFQHSWKTIGSSRNHYKFYKNHSFDSGKNMIITGVPKWDGVIKLKNDSTLPKNDLWDKKLKGKTVFLWNSFYTYMLSSMCYWNPIMEYFQSHPECGLIWRMHPMTKTVMKVHGGESGMQCLLNMEREALKLPNVVIDTNVSYLEAFQYSDAQISDFSSLMTQYLLLDKPLLWIKNSGWNLGGCAIDSVWMETADNENEIKEFFERIKEHKDINKGLRETVRQKDIPLADGKAGERACDEILKLLEKEALK